MRPLIEAIHIAGLPAGSFPDPVLSMLQSFGQDFLYGVRGLRKQPSFTVLAVFTLALGIGAATTMFSVIQNVLLDPFPYVDAQKVVMPQIRDVTRPEGRVRFWMKPREFLEYQEQKHIFSEVIASGYQDVLYTTPEGTERLIGVPVSGNMFQFLGVPAILGRILTPEDTKPGAPPVFVMGYKLWASHFNSDRSILGRSFILNGIPTTLVGVMPKRFSKGDGDVYLAVVLDPADPRVRNLSFRFQARLQPGISLAQAEAMIAPFAQEMARLHPEDYPAKFTVGIISWLDNIVRGFRKTLYTLGAAVALLLLIACANVGNLLLARGSAREKEMAVRAALGASRARLVRQLLVESFLLAVLGSAVGCVLAHFGIKLLVGLMPDHSIPTETVIRLNVPVLCFSLATAAFTAFIFGLIPALHTARGDLAESLQDSSKGGGGGFRGRKIRNGLVVAEVALSLVLLTCAGLLMRSFAKIQQQDLGLETKHVLYVPLSLPEAQYGTAAAKEKLFRELLPRLQALPGVVAVSTGTLPPPLTSYKSLIDIPGTSHAEIWDTHIDLCSEGYFQTLGLKLMRGRLLSPVEIEGGRKSAVVNQTLVRRYFGDDDPIGRRIILSSLSGKPASGAEDTSFEIVGVVADFRNDGVLQPVAPQAFVPYTSTTKFALSLLIRTAGPPLALMNQVRQEIWAQDRSVALTDSDSLANYVDRNAYDSPRFTFFVLGVFASVGLLLVALGVYSVIAYMVAQQTRDFGVRMALGATQGDVLKLVLRNGLGLVGVGLVVGTLFSLAVTKVLFSRELWNVSPYDPLTFGAAIFVVVLAGFVACYFPARRATRVDPMVALRCE